MTTAFMDTTGKFERLARWLLRLAALFPLALLLALGLTLALLRPAQAAQEIVCAGHNLLDEMQASDPDAYARVVAEGAAVPNGKGIFWRVEKAGAAPSWLMGTMHLTDARVLAMPEAARKVWPQAQTVIVESDEILDERKAMASLFAKPELTMLTDGSTITSLLSEADSRKLEDGLKSRGLALPLVARMQPWMIASFVSLPACELTRKAQGASFLDKRIAEDATAQGKALVGLETMEEQLSAMASLPLKFHLDALIETLALGERMDGMIETMIQLYLSGDTGRIMPMVKTLTPGGADPGKGYAAFEQRILIDRNRIMAERAAPYFARGNVFMAVGALHLPGDEGVVALLRKAGYTVTPAE